MYVVLAYYMTAKVLSTLGLLTYFILLTLWNSYWYYHDAHFTFEETEVNYARVVTWLAIDDQIYLL